MVELFMWDLINSILVTREILSSTNTRLNPHPLPHESWQMFQLAHCAFPDLNFMPRRWAVALYNVIKLHTKPPTFDIVQKRSFQSTCATPYRSLIFFLMNLPTHYLPNAALNSSWAVLSRSIPAMSLSNFRGRPQHYWSSPINVYALSNSLLH